MKNINYLNRFNPLLIKIILFFLLNLPNSTSQYIRPDKFYINCGSNSDITYGDQIFVSDFTFNNKGSIATDDQVATDIYKTVRIFTSPSSYNFKLDTFGLYIVRLHFYPQKNLSTSRFTVSSSFGFNLLKDFTLKNISSSNVEEFLLMINSTKFELRFIPFNDSSIAFVNAIEVFLAPNDQSELFLAPNDQNELLDVEKNLHTVYRLNIGGPKITPENDTLGRTWLVDDEYVYQGDAAIKIRSIEKPNYESGLVRRYTAPDFVYQTAKAVNLSRTSQIMMNVTWTLHVKSNSRHYIRFHFCDILSKVLDPESAFFLYVNGNLKVNVDPSLQSQVATPFYYDSVTESDGSGLFNVSISSKGPNTNSGFLNGLEVMELLQRSDIISEKSSSLRNRIYIVIGCVAGVLVIVLSVLVMFWLKRKRIKKEVVAHEVSMWSPLPGFRGDGSSESKDKTSLLRNVNLGLKISLSDILRATNNFDEKTLIGKGGFGDVYKAILPNGTKVAVKRGKGGSGQGKLEFQTEIHVLSRIRHRHLVSLIGYCEEDSEMILVYEFMEKGTLKEHLYGGLNVPILTWKQRLEICIGAARGLHYLHSGSQGTIIHRDVKSTNILLDENNVAKVADFGLSKFAISDQTQNVMSTNIKGTFGYLDPEYLQTHILTEKSDVYAFGVVLLEVLCSRPALDNRLKHEKVNLAEYAMECNSEGRIEEIIDQSLISEIEMNSLKKFMIVVEKCLRDFGFERPSMADVIWDLEYVLQLQNMKVKREPHEDSVVSVTDQRLLVTSLLMECDSFTSNLIVEEEEEEDEVKNDHGGRSDCSSETQVFSQLKISEAR